MVVDKPGGPPDLPWVSVVDTGCLGPSRIHSPFFWFNIWISFLGINSPLLCVVLVGLSIRRPSLFSPSWGGGECGPRQANLVLISRAVNIGWRNLLKLIHYSSSTQVGPSALSTWTPRASSVCGFHQAWFCTFPVDSLSYWLSSNKILSQNQCLYCLQKQSANYDKCTACFFRFWTYLRISGPNKALWS